VKLFDFVDGIEENKDLWFLWYSFSIQIFEDSSNYVFMHLFLAGNSVIIILYSFQSDVAFTQLFLHDFADVELQHILCVLFVELHEFLFHCGRASYHVSLSRTLRYFKNFG
jgi:hypothetical protein